MQTYTHASVGLVLSQAFFPDNIVSQATMVGFSIVPDVPTFLFFVKDKLKGRQPFQDAGKRVILTIDIFHSLIIWGLAILFSWPAFIGVYSHLLLDWLSHKDFYKTDPGMLWPFSYKLRGFFDYRTTGPGKLLTEWDIKITACLLLIFIMLKI